ATLQKYWLSDCCVKADWVEVGAVEGGGVPTSGGASDALTEGTEGESARPDSLSSNRPVSSPWAMLRLTSVVRPAHGAAGDAFVRRSRCTSLSIRSRLSP